MLTCGLPCKCPHLQEVGKLLGRETLWRLDYLSVSYPTLWWLCHLLLKILEHLAMGCSWRMFLQGFPEEMWCRTTIIINIFGIKTLIFSAFHTAVPLPLVGFLSAKRTSTNKKNITFVPITHHGTTKKGLNYKELLLKQKSGSLIECFPSFQDTPGSIPSLSQKGGGPNRPSFVQYENWTKSLDWFFL